MRVPPEKSMGKAYTHGAPTAMRKPSRNLQLYGASAGAASQLVLVGVDEQRLAVGGDHLLVDHHLAHVVQRRQLVHRVEQDLLQDRAQAPRAGLARESALGDRPQGRRAYFQLDAFHQEQPLVLLDERVFRLGEDLDQRVLVELLERGEHRQPADELRDEPVLDEVFRLDVLQQVVGRLGVLRALDLGAEADAGLFGAVAHDLLEAVEGAAADEQDVGGIDLDEVLVRMLAAALRRHRGDGALDQLQQRLLHALARHVPGNRGVIRLARDLVDLVDVDDAALRLVDVVVAVLEQLLDDVLHVLADVARLGERGRVGDHERNVQEARHGLREQRLARSGRADEQDVRFGELDLVVLGEVLQALVVVVDRDRQDLLGELLPDHVLVQYPADFPWRRQVGL